MVRFPDRERHQIFLEPEGLHTDEYYAAGLSTSLPYDVQIELVRSVPGLEKAEIMRPAYAIEYDCIDPTQLELTLETRGPGTLFSRARSMVLPAMKGSCPGFDCRHQCCPQFKGRGTPDPGPVPGLYRCTYR